MMTFSKHTVCIGFVEKFMRLRQQAILDKNKGLGIILKLCHNSSYGQEIIQEKKFKKVVLCFTHQILINYLKPNFINTIKFNNDVYQCKLARKTFDCGTIIQCGFFTLDNFKYWNFNFLFQF
jgi:endonuclease IV